MLQCEREGRNINFPMTIPLILFSFTSRRMMRETQRVTRRSPSGIERRPEYRDFIDYKSVPTMLKGSERKVVESGGEMRFASEISRTRHLGIRNILS